MPRYQLTATGRVDLCLTFEIEADSPQDAERQGEELAERVNLVCRYIPRRSAAVVQAIDPETGDVVGDIELYDEGLQLDAPTVDENAWRR